jgi:hypothetical protein
MFLWINLSTCVGNFSIGSKSYTYKSYESKEPILIKFQPYFMCEVWHDKGEVQGQCE